MNILEKLSVFRWENSTYLVKNSAFCGDKVEGHLLQTIQYTNCEFLAGDLYHFKVSYCTATGVPEKARPKKYLQMVL